MKEIMEKIGVISFVSFEEAYNKKDFIKKVYSKLDIDTKEVYKWYFYKQLCLMTSKKMGLKDYLWLYIVGKENITEKLEEEYAKFREKVDKRKKKYEEKPLNSEIKDIFNLLSYNLTSNNNL